MKDNTKKLSRLAILTALGVVILLLASVLPTGRIALTAIASLAVCVALMMYGWRWAVGVFALTALLSALLFPGLCAAMYLGFFGYYPVAKSLFEKIHSVSISWICKFALYTVVFVLYWLLARTLISFTGRELGWYVLYPLGAAVFFFYDRAFTSLIRFYLVKIARYFA